MITGAGALISPLISTQFSQLPGRKWAFNYLVVLGLHLINLSLIILVYRGREYDGERGTSNSGLPCADLLKSYWMKWVFHTMPWHKPA
jgi:hypothetical protein